MSLRRSPFPGFLSLLTGGWRSSDSWVCSAPLALRGLWSSEFYVTVSRFLFPAPWRPSLFLSLFGFLSWSAWVPLPLGRFRSFRSATSLRPGPWLIVSFELVPVVRFGSASELCSRLFRALPVAWFHPRAVSALSPGLLSPFEVSGFLCPARPCGLPFPLRSFDCPEVSLHFRSWFPSVLPEWLSLSGVSSFYLSLDSGSISVTAYFCSPKGL